MESGELDDHSLLTKLLSEKGVSCDDHVSTYHVYCIILLVFIDFIPLIIIGCVVRSFLPIIFITREMSLDFLEVLVPFITWKDPICVGQHVVLHNQYSIVTYMFMIWIL